MAGKLIDIPEWYIGYIFVYFIVYVSYNIWGKNIPNYIRILWNFAHVKKWIVKTEM